MDKEANPEYRQVKGIITGLGLSDSDGDSLAIVKVKDDLVGNEFEVNVAANPDRLLKIGEAVWVRYDVHHYGTRLGEILNIK